MTGLEKYRKKHIRFSDPGKILDVVMQLTDDRSTDMQVKINTYLEEECEAEVVFMMYLLEERQKGHISVVGSNAFSRTYSVTICQKYYEILKSEKEINCYYDYLGGEVKNIVGNYFSAETKSNKKRIFIIPATRGQSPLDMTALVFVVGSKFPDASIIGYVQELYLFVWPTLQKTLAFEYERNLKEKCQHLLRVAQKLFTKIATKIDIVLKEVMDHCKQLIKADHCSILIIDADRMKLYEPQGVNTSGDRLRPLYPMGVGITGHVISTGKIVNSLSPKDHPAFDPSIDFPFEGECRSILFFPIREEYGIIGVGRLINKIGDLGFDRMDEEMAMAFSVYCGICIMQAILYHKLREAHIRNALANELVTYHMKVTDNEVNQLLTCSGYHEHPHFANLHFSPRVLPPKELSCYTLMMFCNLDFPNKFNISRKKMARFILHVKKGYRDVPYHNYLHSASVTQWAYASLVNFKLVEGGHITDLQALMFFISAMVHDLDHRGTTNSFQIQGQTTLAALYSSEGSVMERHHIAQALSTLNTEGCDILSSLPRRDYDHALLLLRDCVLATDLSNYFKNYSNFEMVSYDYQPGNALHSSYLLALLMNSADLADQIRDWDCVKKTAAVVLTEFFKQGEAERSLGAAPPAIMDRERCLVPALQIQFIESTCIPLFAMLARMLPGMQHVEQILRNHVERWDAAKPIFEEVPLKAGLTVLLSPELDHLIEINMAEAELRRQEAAEAEAEAEAA